jgi:hypothetical protein
MRQRMQLRRLLCEYQCSGDKKMAQGAVLHVTFDRA